MTRLELGGLSREAVGELAVRSCLDADELFERTNGNPFFVTEALAAGIGDVPATVSDAVHARVAGLEPAAGCLGRRRGRAAAGGGMAVEALTDGTSRRS